MENVTEDNGLLGILLDLNDTLDPDMAQDTNVSVIPNVTGNQNVADDTDKTQTSQSSQLQSQSILSDPIVPEVPCGKRRRLNHGKGRQPGKLNAPPPATPATPGSSTKWAETNQHAGKGKGKGRKRRRSTPEQTPEKAPQPTNESQCVADAINKLADQIGVLSKRIERLESGIDAKVKTQVQKAINPAIEKIKNDFESELQKVREEMKDEINTLKENQHVSQANQTHSESTDLNIVIRNLPHSENENTKIKVNTFIKDILKLNVEIASAQRRQPRNESESGVIVAKCKSKDDKLQIMRAKAKLRHSRVYSNVYIEHDLTIRDRNTMSNFRTLANAIGNDKLFVRGNKLIIRSNQQQTADEMNDDWHEVRYRYRNNQTTYNTHGLYNRSHNNNYRDNHRDHNGDRDSNRYTRENYRRETRGIRQGGGDRATYHRDGYNNNTYRHNRETHDYDYRRSQDYGRSHRHDNTYRRNNTYRRQRD